MEQIKTWKDRMPAGAPAHDCIPAMLEEITELRNVIASQRQVIAGVALCPFCGPTCGSAPRIQSRAAKCASGRQHFVRCPMCHTEGPRSNLSADEAITAWNRRAPVAPHQESAA